jgi:membrane protease YdiL (CAAX protease family)
VTRLRLLAVIEVLACSGLPTQLAIGGLLALVGITPFDADRQLATDYVFALALLDAAALLALVGWFLRLHGEEPGRVMLGTRPVWPEVLRGLLQVPVVFLIVVAVMLTARSLAPWLHNVEKNPFEILIRSAIDAAMFAVVAVVGGGVREEVQRAFILHRFEQHLGGRHVGLVISSVAFVLGHIIQGRDVAVATAVLGAFWGWMYLRRRSIASTVVSHSGFNAAEIFRYTFYGA